MATKPTVTRKSEQKSSFDVSVPELGVVDTPVDVPKDDDGFVKIEPIDAGREKSDTVRVEPVPEPPVTTTPEQPPAPRPLTRGELRRQAEMEAGRRALARHAASRAAELKK